MWQDLRAAWTMRSMLRVMVWRELAARHSGTAGGIAWVYAQPLLTVAAYYLVFDVVFAARLGDAAPTKAVGTFLIVGLLPWQAFCEALGRGTSSLIESGHLLQKNALPPVLMVLRTVLASAWVYMPLLLLVALAYTPLHGWSLGLLALPLVLVGQLLLVCVWAYVLAILAAALRDTVQLVAFGLSVGVFLSPILFPVALFPEAWRWVLWLNPMTAWVLAYQNMLLLGDWPTWQSWCGMAAWIGTGGLALAPLLRRSRDELVDWL